MRYRLNDILVESKAKCKCGSPCTLLEKIEGREDDIFAFENSGGKCVKVFPDAIRRCMMFAGDIDNYRVVQNEDSSVTIYVDCDEALKEKVRKSFAELAKDMGFVLTSITFSSYSYDKSRKLKRVESLRKGHLEKLAFSKFSEVPSSRKPLY